MKFDFDVIVIGSGSGWLTTSIGLTNAWKKVALIEKWLIWGDCTNYGCIPSKALIDIAKKDSEKTEENKIGLLWALTEVRARRKLIQDEETPDEIKKHWMSLFQWIASFQDKNTVKIYPSSIDIRAEWWKEQVITAKNIIISTGSSSNNLDIDWLKKDDILTNKEIFELEEDIKNLVIIWGWYIGCELAEAFSNLWVNVTILQRNTSIIPREEKESSELLTKLLKDKWIQVLTSVEIKQVKNKQILISNKYDKDTKNIPFDKILFAAGRKANIEKLLLDKAWIKYKKNGIVTDKFNRTNIKNIYAIWDCVAGNPQFTHWANAQWRAVIQSVLVPFLKKSVNNDILPATLYTNYEVSRVWKTYEELLENYSEQEIVSKIMYFDVNDRSKVTDDTTGFIKIHFKRLTGKILWATVMWNKAGEILPIITAAMENNISAYKLSKQIFSYPTKSETIKKIADSFVIQMLSNIKNEVKFFIKNNILQIITWFLWISIIIGFFSYKQYYDLSLEQLALNLYNFIAMTYYWPLIYILLYAIRPIILFPATLMTFMSGALFGFWWGFAFTMIGENLSAIFAYTLWRIFGKKIIKNWDSWSFIQTLKTKVNKDPFINILLARFLFFPFDLTNYASWLLKVRLKSFIWATIIWIIPWASVFILAWAAFYNKELLSFSDEIKDIDLTMLYYAAILFMITIVIAKIIKKVTMKKNI